MRIRAQTEFFPIPAILTAIVLVSFGLINSAAADTLVRFNGVVDSISAGYEIPGIDVGDPVAGTLVFDPATPDGAPASWLGYYPDAIVSLNVTIGSKVFSLSTAGSPASEIDVINDENVYGTYYDQMWFRIAVEEANEPGTVRFFQLSFSIGATVPPSVLLNDTLPAAPPLGAFDVRRGFITYMPPGASQGCNFALTNIEVTPVVDPSALEGDDGWWHRKSRRRLSN